MIRKILFATCTVLCLCAAKLKAQERNTIDTVVYYRKQIDTLDNQIIDLLGKRMNAARAIGWYKMDHRIEVVQSARFDEVLNAAILRSKDQHLSEEFIRALYNDIHKESIRQEEGLHSERKRTEPTN
jgi:chorismate mutase